MAGWAAAMNKAWRRHASMLALEWGVWNRKQAEVVRKDYHGFMRISPITGESELHYPAVSRPSC